MSTSDSQSSTEKLPLSTFFPEYFVKPQTSKRLRKLKSSRVKLLRVLDENGQVAIAFQDEDSEVKYGTLLDLMRKFYTSPEGCALIKPLKFLKVGEIVAAIVCTRSNETVVRRVKVDALFDAAGKSKALAVDIDHLNHWYISSAFTLLEEFYQHPAQACRAEISNFHELYPKEIFEEFLKGKDDCQQIMSEITQNILLSQEGKNIYLSNIEVKTVTMNDEVMDKYIGEIDLTLNWMLPPYFLEEFCNYFTPIAPTVGCTGVGIITDVTRTGDIGLCTNESLYKIIDIMINSKKVWEMADNITDEIRKNLVDTISSGECCMFLVFNLDKTKILRAKVKSIYENKMKVFLLDASKDVHLSTDHLICPLTNNRDLSALLASIPPQAIRLHIRGIELIRESECETLRGTEVKFKVEDSKYKLEVDLFNTSCSTISINAELKEQNLAASAPWSKVLFERYDTFFLF